MRTLVIGALSTLLGVGAALAAGDGRAAADGAAFSNGVATAQASVLRIAPGLGSLQLATTSGTSLATLTNNVAQAQSQSIDLGLVGTALTAQQCTGAPG